MIFLAKLYWLLLWNMLYQPFRGDTVGVLVCLFLGKKTTTLYGDIYAFRHDGFIMKTIYLRLMYNFMFI